MPNHFQELASILGKELFVFRELRELLEQETRPLVEFDLLRIEEINKAKETLELRHRILEQARLETVKLLAEQLGLAPTEATLDLLSRRAPVAWGHTLARLRDTFVRLTDDLKRKVEDNSRLVQSSLKLIHGLQMLIVRTIEEPATYEEAGRIRKAEVVYSQNGRRI